MYKSQKIPTQLNSYAEKDNSVKSQGWLDAKKNLKMINKTVI